MKLLPTLLMTLGLLASPALLADEQKAAPPAHGEPGHNHATDHGQTAPETKPDDHAHEHKDGDHDHAKDDHQNSDHDHAKDDHQDDGHEHSSENHASHHGGIVAITDGHVHHELVTAEDGKVSLYAEGLPEGDALKTVKVRLTVLRGKDKQEAEMTLASDDAHRFDAAADFRLEPGDKVVALVQLPDGKSRMAKFDLPTEK